MKYDNSILENIYLNVLKEMAFGLSGSGESLTIKELIDYIINLNNDKRGTMNISFTSIIIPKFRKTNFPYKNLYKVKQVQGQIGTDYEKSVNRQREKEGVEGEFKAEPSRVIKERISQSVGITFQNNYVLIYRPKLITEPSYFFVEDQNGEVKEVPKKEIETFLPSYKPSERQEVEKTIDYLTYKFDNIIGMKIDGKDHTILDVDPIKKQIYEMVKDRLKF
jgi:hypothetical protein